MALLLFQENTNTFKYSSWLSDLAPVFMLIFSQLLFDAHAQAHFLLLALRGLCLSGPALPSNPLAFSKAVGSFAPRGTFDSFQTCLVVTVMSPSGI